MAEERATPSPGHNPGEPAVASATAQKTLFDLGAPTVADRARPLAGSKSYARIADIQALPRLIDVQLRSFEWFKEEGLRELFEETFPSKATTGR
jgi:DNA-directed RNA polymerase beta subunit